MSALLSPIEELNKRVNRVLETFSRADTTLRGRPVTVQLADAAIDTPAYTLGDTINFNIRKVKAEEFSTPEGLVRLLGLNYHELAHVFYTPSRTSQMHVALGNRGIANEGNASVYIPMWNILEDQRIERLLCGRYLACAPYLVSIFMHYILSDPKTNNMKYPLVAGRRHVPKRVRDELRRQFVVPAILDDIDQVVNEYLTIKHPTDDQWAIDLVVRFYELAKQLPATPPDYLDHDCRPVPNGLQSGNKTVAPEEVQEASEAADAAEASGMLDIEEKAAKEAADDDDSDAGSDDDDTGGEGGEGEESDNAGNSDGGSDGNGDGGDDDETTDDGKPGSGSGGSNGTPDLTTIANDVLNNINVDPSVDGEVKQALDSSRGNSSYIESTLPYRRPSSYATPTPEMRTAVERFAEELRRVYDEVAPGWDTHKPSGRVNIQRVMHAETYDTVYDQWNPGQADAYDMETTISVDLSSSMTYNQMYVRACTAAWIVRRAMEIVGNEARVTTLGYDSTRHMTLQPRNEPLDPERIPIVSSQDTTDPSLCMTESRKIFDASEAKHKVMFVMTDGAWDGVQRSVDADTSIQMMNDAGVVTCLVYMSNHKVEISDVERHNCTYVSVFNDWSDLVTIVRKIVTDIMKGEL